MPLPNAYIQAYGQLAEMFKKIQEGQAPPKFSQQYLKDLGFTSSSHRALIPLLKVLGFISSDGTPTEAYHNYRDKSQSRIVLGNAVKSAYQDLFLIKSNPTESDRELIEGKFKSTHNVSDRVAQLMASTFFALLPLANINHDPIPLRKPEESKEEEPKPKTVKDDTKSKHPSLHYNIQIHLPATKDIEVFNAIFKSLKEHLLD